MGTGDLLVLRFDKLPSGADFARIEERNVPAVIVGALKTWPAYRLWDPSNGGLHRLKELAGGAMVQAMATDSGSNFYGEIRGHERVSIKFESFLNFANTSKTTGNESGIHENQQGFEMVPDSQIEGKEFVPGASNLQLYMAQVGMFSQEDVNVPPLSALMADIETPRFLQSTLSNINLWMSVNGSRSSTHYDPYHNLLCVVFGCKEVRFWPPSSAPSLYPLPIHGEASNHIQVDFVNPDLKRYPRFESAMAGSQTVTVHAGDALFLPEGWYHQVDSEDVTIAVNFWWQSEVSSKLGSHMDAYFLRRVLANLVDAEKEEMIREVKKVRASDVRDVSKHVNRSGHLGFKEKPESSLPASLSQGLPAGGGIDSSTEVFENSESSTTELSAKTGEFHQKDQSSDLLDKSSKLFLNSKTKGRDSNCPSQEELVMDTHSQMFGCTPQTDKLFAKVACRSEPFDYPVSEDSSNRPPAPLLESCGQKGISLKTLTRMETQSLRTLVLSVSTLTEMPSAENVEISSGLMGKAETGDCLAQIFSALAPPSLQRVLLVMSSEFPRTFEALILHGLSPAASEILTRRFEQMDGELELEISQEEFYERIYSVFDDPRLAMASLLDGKESFSALALKRVMDQYLGLSCIPFHG